MMIYYNYTGPSWHN